jgi:hypothetical protein
MTQTIALATLAGPFGGRSPGAVSTVGLYLFANADESCTYFCDPGNIGGFYIYRIDYTGAYTKYWCSTAAHNDNIALIIPFGAGNYFVSTNAGLVYFVQTLNLKLNNVTPYSINNGPVIATSCGDDATLTALFYDATQQIMAAGFYQAYESADDIWNLCYSVNPITGGITLTVGGFCGNSLAGDPFNQTQRTLPPGASDAITATASNGMLATRYVSSGNLFGWQQETIKIAAGVNTICNPVGLYTGCHVTSQSANDFLSNFSGSDNAYLVDSCIQGFGGINAQSDPDSYAYIFGPAGAVYVVEFVPAGTSPILTNVAVTPKHIFALGSVLFDSVNTTGQIWISANSGIGPPPQVSIAYGGYAVNNARPISLSGNYLS